MIRVNLCDLSCPSIIFYMNPHAAITANKPPVQMYHVHMCLTHSNNKIKLKEKPLRLHCPSGRMNLRKQPWSPVKLYGETFPKQCCLCKWTAVFTPPWTNHETNHQTKWPEHKYIKYDLPGRTCSLCIHFHTLQYMHFVCETGLLILGVTLLIVNYNKQSSDYLKCCTTVHSL